jgi:hypothetical protein
MNSKYAIKASMQSKMLVSLGQMANSYDMIEAGMV